MNPHPGPHGGAASAAAGLDPLHAVLPLLLGALLLAYLALAAMPDRYGRGRWPLRRTVAFVGGCLVSVWALAGPLGALAHDDLAAHMSQHVLVGMLGPFLMVLGAPVTLLLRTLPGAGARRLGRLLHTPYLRFLAHPVVALGLSVGTLPILYGTGLYAASAGSPVLAQLLHVHFLASGYLFAWVIAGPDPAPHRPSVRYRLWVLGVAVLVHAGLSQLMYAGALAVEAPPAQLRAAATVMYYGGDLVELALAVSMLRAWPAFRRVRTPRPIRTGATTQRRAGAWT